MSKSISGLCGSLDVLVPQCSLICSFLALVADEMYAEADVQPEHDGMSDDKPPPCPPRSRPLSLGGSFLSSSDTDSLPLPASRGHVLEADLDYEVPLDPRDTRPVESNEVYELPDDANPLLNSLGEGSIW